MKEYAIIVAGGNGLRMGAELPKQFLNLSGKPVLMHTIEAFNRYSESLSLIVVLPLNQIELWDDLIRKHSFKIPHLVVPGGKTRFGSVKNGLQEIEETECLVAIHDGVRPLVQKEIIGASFRLAEIHGSAIAAVRLKESIRQVNQNTTRSVDRSAYRQIQTPQTFRYALIRNAYEIEETPDITDDAGVAERFGVKISLFEGSYENLKITTPEDLVVAEAILKYRNDQKKKK